MKKITKEKIEQINAFWDSNKNLEQIICDELKSRKIKSIKCMSLGRLNYEYGDKNTIDTVYLGIGFKKIILLIGVIIMENPFMQQGLMDVGVFLTKKAENIKTFLKE